jgi:hypothetical protein
MTGTWYLIVILNVGTNQMATIPWLKYTDLGFGWWECEQAKESYMRTLVYKYRLECVRMGDT